MSDYNESFDLSNDFEISFEVKREYHVIITDSKTGAMERSGKRYIEHTLLGLRGEKFRKRFFIETDGGKRYYTRFLSSCGIAQEETKNWIPSKLDGKFLTVDFKNEEKIEQVYDEETGMMVDGGKRSNFELNNFRTCTALQKDKDLLSDLADDGIGF
jgi:hypothetical protein